MSTLAMWFNFWFLRKKIDKYPNRPLLYVCSDPVRAITGVIRAEDFDDEVRRMRKQFEKNGHFPNLPIRPQVYPLFLFANTIRQKIDFRVGDLLDLNELMQGCMVEYRTFELPPLNAPGTTPLGYFGATEPVGREGVRHRSYTLEQAREYLHNGNVTWTMYS